MGAEKRKFTRFHFKMDSELYINDDVYKLDEIMNLSIGGCLLPVTVDANPGDECFFKIILGDNDEAPVVSIDGKIVRIADDTTAINFIRIDPDSLEHLHRIAQYNSPDPDKTEEEIKEHPGLL